jgi:hypothetical protein
MEWEDEKEMLEPSLNNGRTNQLLFSRISFPYYLYTSSEIFCYLPLYPFSLTQIYTNAHTHMQHALKLMQWFFFTFYILQTNGTSLKIKISTSLLIDLCFKKNMLYLGCWSLHVNFRERVFFYLMER